MANSNTKLVICLIVGIVIGVIFGPYVFGSSGISQTDYDKAVADLEDAENDLTAMTEEKDDIESERDALQTALDGNITQYENALAQAKDEIARLNDENEHLQNLANSTDPVQTNSSLTRLHVEGNKIKNAYNQTVVLYGTSVLDIGNSQTRNRFPTATRADYEHLKYVWNADWVGFLVHPNIWENHEEEVKMWMKQAVDVTEELGMYLKITYHAGGNPGIPTNGTGNPDINLVYDFWTTIAPLYGDRVHVIFDIFSEPASITWDEWRNNYAQPIVDAIREDAPDTLILVGGVDSGYDLRGVLTNPIIDHNTGYSAHPYPVKCAWERFMRDPYGCPSEWQLKFGNTAEVYVVVVTEFGFRSNPDTEWGNHIWGADERWGNAILDYLEDRGISWFAWHFSNTYGPALLKSMDPYYETTESGAVFKARMIAN